MQAAKDRFGTIDVLVNNAGYGYRAAVEESEDEAVSRLFATNFFGPVDLIKAVLPDMRAQRRGAIVNVSSVAALEIAPGFGLLRCDQMRARRHVQRPAQRGRAARDQGHGG